MGRAWLGRIAANILLVAVLAAAAPSFVAAQGAAEADRLNAQVIQLYRAGRYAEAIPLAQRLVTLREKALGPDHPDVAAALTNLAAPYLALSRHAEAEPLLQRSLRIREKALGPDHPEVGQSLNNLAALYDAQGRYGEVEPFLRRSLAIREKALGPDHTDVGTTLNNLALLYRTQGRYAEAEPLFKRSLAIAEKALGPDHPGFAESLNNLAGLYAGQGRYAESEALYQRSLAIREKALGPDHPLVAASLDHLAGLALERGRYAEAEPLIKRSLAIVEEGLGSDHPSVAASLESLAKLYRAQGRFAEAEPLFRRSLAIVEKALGPDHLDVGSSLNNLAELYRDQGRNAEAEPLYRRSLAIVEKALGSDHLDVATSLNNIALTYEAQGRYADAEQLYRRSLAIRKKALGQEHLDVAQSLNNLGLLYRAQGRHADAEVLIKATLAITEKALGPDHPRVGTTHGALALLALAQNDLAGASDHWRRATAVWQRRSMPGLGGALEGSIKDETQRSSWYFEGLVKTTHRLAAEGRGNAQAFATEMFEMAQWGQGSEAAATLAQMAARSAKGSPELAALAREQQDLVNEWQTKDKLLIAAKSRPSNGRNAADEKVMSDRLAAIEKRLAEINSRFAKDFPDYAALASPKPVLVGDVQASLRDDEALVLFLDTGGSFEQLPEETFIWVVTKTDVRWVRSEPGTATLAREVAALRCGLDATKWDDAAQNCEALTKAKPSRTIGNDVITATLPFDHERAYKLYQALFAQAEDLIKGKSLIVVPSGPLTQLPFQVLVTAPSASADHKAVAWLARDHAITVLPAVSSLKALRRVARESAAAKPMIGFGNPLLDGPDSRYANLAQLAREKQRCPKTLWQRMASFAGLRSGIAPIETRGRPADAAKIKKAPPLPETADELCAVAKDLGADERDIYLGARASEREIKKLSAEGKLAQYRIVHFATHGALAGQISGSAEPGLILTPPEIASEDDDGYLTASEIAGLKLDADWVILSACNTAAHGAQSAEALSGLARAFIYAQARALLVSHWEVNSAATVKLITGAMKRLATNKSLGRAEAMRQSMLALIDKGEAHEAHPAFWAPFVVVGEGGAGK